MWTMVSTTGAFGDDGSVSRKLDWKMPMFSGRMLPRTPNASQCDGSEEAQPTASSTELIRRRRPPAEPRNRCISVLPLHNGSGIKLTGHGQRSGIARICGRAPGGGPHPPDAAGGESAIDSAAEHKMHDKPHNWSRQAQVVRSRPRTRLRSSPAGRRRWRERNICWLCR
jgi:hypothetical protein